MGSGATTFLKVVLKNFNVLAGPVVGLLYPLYASIRAMETKSEMDNEQWLSYWVLHSMLTLFELTFASVLEWIPIWPYAKLVVVCWLSGLSGAAYVYQHYLRPIMAVKQQQKVKVWYVPKGKEPLDIMTSADKYIKEHGTGDLQYMLHNAEVHMSNDSGYYGYAEEKYEY